MREINAQTLRPILKLSVSDEQKKFVADNTVSVAQAYFCKQAWFRAVYVGEIPVSFVMPYIDTKKNNCEELL